MAGQNNNHEMASLLAQHTFGTTEIAYDGEVSSWMIRPCTKNELKEIATSLRSSQ